MNHSRPHISVVAPAYCCADCLPELCRRLELTLDRIDPNYEIVFVNDASPQRDWQVIGELAARNPRVKGINFSRNFGQHHAITAGVDYASGEWVVVMDCDLQDQPEEIAKLYSKASGEGFEIVFGRRIQRRDTAFKTFLSRSFHLTFWYLADVKLDPTVANFSIATHQVMEVYRGLRESGRSHFLTLLWCGFRVGYADVDHAERFAGKTTYTLRRSLDLAFDSITARSNKPLRLSIMAGFLMSALSLLLAANIVVRKLVWGIPVSGWASTMVSIYFTGGLLMANLGVIGLYLGKVFDQARNRPIYVVRECVNFTNPALGTSGGASTSR